MEQLEIIIKKIIAFRDERDWEQFHNSKDLAIALNIETSELLELFLWKDNEEVDPIKLQEEVADIFMYALLIANKHKLNIIEIIEKKLKVNQLKYPVDRSKGNARKYNEF